MLKIGELSKLSRLPIKTLRYYDELGLFKPSRVDPVNNYRYYSADQLTRLNRILALKELGLTLEQIRLLLEKDLPASQVVGMLRRRQVELLQEINDHQSMLEKIEIRLSQFEQEGMMSEIEVVIKSVPALWIASVRGVVPTYPDQGSLWGQLMQVMEKESVKFNNPCFTIDHDDDYKEVNHDLEVCFPLDGEVKLPAPAVVRQLPAVAEMASLIHHGPFNTLYLSYQEMIKWLDTRGYQIVGPGREIYVYCGEGESRQDDPSYVTEIQFPVQRVK